MIKNLLIFLLSLISISDFINSKSYGAMSDKYYLNIINNWGNNSFWEKRSLGTKKTLCAMYKISIEKNNKYSEKSKENFNKYCKPKIIINSDDIIGSKIYECDQLIDVDFIRNERLSSLQKRLIVFNDCVQIYKLYSKDKRFMNRYWLDHKMYYIFVRGYPP